jgi:quercetin dioxygenase-like cupin family protein
MTQATPTAFTIFRAAEAPDLMVEGCMTMEPFTPVQRQGMTTLVEGGYLDGAEIKVLVNIPGYSVTHVWFKEGYPLPLHSHDADCLYYVIAGEVRLGTEVLGTRDCVFIPKDTPYTYKTGPDGAELLEIRHASHFSFLNLAKGEAFWVRAAEDVAARREAWRTAVPPTAIA